MLVRGRVTNADGEPIAGAELDVWQANDEGFYDVQQKSLQPELNLRGVFETEADGSFWFRAVKPKYYPIPDDGPDDWLLAAVGRHPYRPADLHFIVTAPGYEQLATHLFVPDDPYIHSDAVFGVKQSFLGVFVKKDDPAGAKELSVATPFWEIEYDLALAPKKG